MCKTPAKSTLALVAAAAAHRFLPCCCFDGHALYSQCGKARLARSSRVIGGGKHLVHYSTWLTHIKSLLLSPLDGVARTAIAAWRLQQATVAVPRRRCQL